MTPAILALLHRRRGLIRGTVTAAMRAGAFCVSGHRARRENEPPRAQWILNCPPLTNRFRVPFA